MDRISNFSPDDIANWISENGVISETYHGLRVEPGKSPIDQLLNIVDVNYLDFDPDNTKFQILAKDVFMKNNMEYPTNPEAWATLIKSSAQSDQLKNLLLTQLKQSPQKVASKTGPKGIRITLRNGKVIDATETGDLGPKYDWIYVAIGPAGKYRHSLNSVTRMKDLGWFLGYDAKARTKISRRNGKTNGSQNNAMFRKYDTLKTVKKSNIISIKTL